jgi:hypothetical protein
MLHGPAVGFRGGQRYQSPSAQRCYRIFSDIARHPVATVHQHSTQHGHITVADSTQRHPVVGSSVAETANAFDSSTEIPAQDQLSADVVVPDLFRRVPFVVEEDRGA